MSNPRADFFVEPVRQEIRLRAMVVIFRKSPFRRNGNSGPDPAEAIRVLLGNTETPNHTERHVAPVPAPKSQRRLGVGKLPRAVAPLFELLITKQSPFP